MVCEMIDQLSIRTAGPAAAVTGLGGGNQQKCIIGRWLLTNPAVLLLDDPTRGVDVGVKAELYRMMDRLCRKGIAIVLTSSVQFNPDERLLIVHDLEADRRREVKVNLEGSESDVYCLGAESGDRIYGGSNHPANVFYYDRSKKELVDYGLSLGVQTYAIAKAGDGLFFTTYTGGQIFFLDPRLPIEKDTNPKRVAKLSDAHEQERLYALVPGPDGHLYIPSVPTKGKLGGALTRLDPATLEYKVYRGIIPNQSVISVAAVPETGELFGTSDIRGGTSAHPSEQDGVIFLWDPKTERLVYQSSPVAGAIGYRDAVRAENGIIYCRAGKTIVAFDPVTREVVGQSESPVKLQMLAAEPAGPAGTIYGIGEGAILAIAPADHQCRVLARHASLEDSRGQRIRGCFIDTDLNLYYGQGSHLWRCRLSMLE